MSWPNKLTRRLRGARPWWWDASSGALAILLAAVVWMVAIYEHDPPREDSFDGVPIRYINLDEELVLVGSRVDRALLTVRAPSSQWSSLKADMLEATVDLRDLAEGVHSVEVKARALDRMAIVTRGAPARVVVRLEESIQRGLEIQAVVADADSMPPGYATASPELSLERVTVSGPRTLVEQVSQVQAKVWLRGSRTSIESEVSLVPLNDRGESVSGLTLTPPVVGVKLAVEALAEFRDVTVRAVVRGSPAPGYWVSNVIIEPPTVTVEGKPETIRAMTAVVSTLPVDISGIKEGASRRVALILPEGVSIYGSGTSGQSVVVRVEVTAIVSGKTVQPKVGLLGLRSGLVAAVYPDTVDVILSGPMPELLALQAEDVRVLVNLFGLGVGRHRVTPTVQLPEDSSLRAERHAPDVVEVVITAAPRGGS